MVLYGCSLTIEYTNERETGLCRSGCFDECILVHMERITIMITIEINGRIHDVFTEYNIVTELGLTINRPTYAGRTIITGSYDAIIALLAFMCMV